MSLDRRQFLAATAALGATSAMAPLVHAGRTAPDWAIGFEGVTEDLAPRPLKITGRIPEACHGTLYRNGPALYQRGGQRYRHWFDPDGMIQAFRLGPGTVEHRGRFVRTTKFQREAAAGRFLYDGAGSTLAGTVAPRNNESLNTANINVQPLAGELLALWEAGAPYRVDPATLETLGRPDWPDELTGVPFSAHPRRDLSGDLWNIGSIPFAGRPMLILYQVGHGGELKQWRMHTLDFAGYMHDFVLTPRYLIALNSSAVVGEGDTFVDSLRWEGTRPSQLLLFDREDLSLVRTIEVPPTFVFHFGNAWEAGETTVFTACEYGDASLVTEGMRHLAEQASGPGGAPPELVRYEVTPRAGTATVTRLGTALEFPGFDHRRPFAAQPLLGVEETAASTAGLASAVQRIDPVSGAADRYDYGEGTIVEEPLHVPGTDGDYVIHSYLDYRDRRSGLAILRADRLADGPLARAEMDRVLPLGFHGCFLAAT